MGEIDIKDQVAALLKEIRAQTAKVEVVSATLDRITAKLDWGTVKAALAASSTAAATSMVSPVQPAAATPMVSPLDVHDAVPPSSGQSSVTTHTTELVSELPAMCATPTLVHDICCIPDTATPLCTRGAYAPSMDAPSAPERPLVASLELDKQAPTRCLVLGAAALNNKSTTDDALGDKSMGVVSFDNKSVSVPVALEAALLSGLRMWTVPKPEAPAHTMSTQNCSIQYKVQPLRPVPWPSFADDTSSFQLRPPWPSFKMASGSKFPNDAITNPSEWCYMFNQTSWPLPRIGTIWLSCKGLQRQSELKPWPDELQSQCIGGDGPAMGSPFAALCEDWVLPSWDSGQQASVSCDRSPCSDLYTSCLPRYFLTNGQIQVSDACSTWQLFLNASSTSFLLAKILVQAKEPSGILSGLINRATSVLELLANSRFEFLLRDTTSEEAAPWLSEDNQTAEQHFNDSVSCGVHRSSFALFQWEIACQIEGSANYASNNRTLESLQRYTSFSIGNCFGVEWFTGVLLQADLLFQIIGHVTSCGFELLQWQIAWSRLLQCSEITRAGAVLHDATGLQSLSAVLRLFRVLEWKRMNHVADNCKRLSQDWYHRVQSARAHFSHQLAIIEIVQSTAQDSGRGKMCFHRTCYCKLLFKMLLQTAVRTAAQDTSSRGLLQTAVPDAPNGLKKTHVWDGYAVEQLESQQPPKFSSAQSKSFGYAGSRATGFSDCEWMPICTQNISVYFESHMVVFRAFSDGPVYPFSQWLQIFVQLNYQDQDICLDIVYQLCAKRFRQAWYVESPYVIYRLVGVSASSPQISISVVNFPDLITLGLPDEDDHVYFLCWDPGGSTFFLFPALDRRATSDKGRCGLISVVCHFNRDRSIAFIDYLCFYGPKILHTPWDPGVREVAAYAHTFLMLRLEHGELTQWLANGLFGAYWFWWAPGVLLVFADCGLRASRRLRRGECHVPTVTWAVTWTGPAVQEHTQSELALRIGSLVSLGYIRGQTAHAIDIEEQNP